MPCALQTGTLTENRMTVVEGWFAGKSYKGKVPDMLDLPEAVRPHLELNIAMNSKVDTSLLLVSRKSAIELCI